MTCLHCGSVPVLRHDEASGLFMMACSGCKARGEASGLESRARLAWSIVNDEELPLHPCKKGERPRFFQRAGRWGSFCKGCGHIDEGTATLEGAVAAWMRESRHYAKA